MSKLSQDSPPAGNGKKHWAGAQRPKVETTKKTILGQARRGSRERSDDSHPQETPASDVYTPRIGVNINLKLRQQAAKLGLMPGSPRWRAYVLGTQQASKRRKCKKRTTDETGVVTPGK
jgi:hypothetical protein